MKSQHKLYNQTGIRIHYGKKVNIYLRYKWQSSHELSEWMVVLRRRNENKTVEIPTICFSSCKKDWNSVDAHTYCRI